MEPPKKEFVVNLDSKEERRWDEIGRAYATDIKKVTELFKSGTCQFPGLPKEMIGDTLEYLGKNLEMLLPSPYKEELQGLAEVTGVPIGDLFFTNLGYDLTANCTSIVSQTTDGKIFHARNLDLPPEFEPILAVSRDLVITVHFRKDGKIIYSGVTTAGYIGLVTGQKPRSFTITHNGRRTGYTWLDVLERLQEFPGAEVGLVIRDALADPDITFYRAMDKMKDVPLIASSYITIAGMQAGEGVVITRDREGVTKPYEGVWKLDADSGIWYVVQTNNDHWTEPPNLQPPSVVGSDSYQRQKDAVKHMYELGRCNIDPKELFDVLSKPLTLNSRTIYTSVMSAAEPSLLKTWTWVRELPRKTDYLY